jgi:hypothetical protein
MRAHGRGRDMDMDVDVDGTCSRGSWLDANETCPTVQLNQDAFGSRRHGEVSVRQLSEMPYLTSGAKAVPGPSWNSNRRPVLEET